MNQLRWFVSYSNFIKDYTMESTRGFELQASHMKISYLEGQSY